MAGLWITPVCCSPDSAGVAASLILFQAGDSAGGQCDELFDCFGL